MPPVPSTPAFREHVVQEPPEEAAPHFTQAMCSGAALTRAKKAERNLPPVFILKCSQLWVER